jgi:hypothetical protein
MIIGLMVSQKSWCAICLYCRSIGVLEGLIFTWTRGYKNVVLDEVTTTVVWLDEDLVKGFDACQI